MAEAPEEVWVPIGTESSLRTMARAMGVKRAASDLLTSPTGRLMVVERKVDLRSKRVTHFWLQVIINPWTWADKRPVVDLLNVDLQAPEGFHMVDDDEGRCRWSGSSQPWPGGGPPQDPGEWLLNLVNTDVARAMDKSTARPFSPKPNASGVRFPAGLLQLESSFSRFAEGRGLVLRSEDDHRRRREEEALRAQQEAEAEAVAAEARRLRRDQALLDLQQAEDEAGVDAVLEGFAEEEHEDLKTEVVAAAEARRQDLNSLKPMPSFDDPAFTTDTSVQPRRRKKGIRTFDEVG